MRCFTAGSISALALFVFYNVIYSKGDATLAVKKSPGQMVREAIENDNQVRSPATPIVRNGSVLDLKKPLGKWKYRMTYSSDLKFPIASRPFTARSTDWNVEKGTHVQEIRLIVVVSNDGANDARHRLYEVMGVQTSRMITANTYGIVKDGPGDVCFNMLGPWTKEWKRGTFLHQLWFVRDNIGISLACSGNTDLLPIAKALDEAIRSCPVLESVANILLQDNEVHGLIIRKEIPQQWIKGLDSKGRKYEPLGVSQEAEIADIKVFISYGEFANDDEAHQAAEFHVRDVAAIFHKGMWSGAGQMAIGNESWFARDAGNNALLIRSGRVCVLLSCHGGADKKQKQLAELLTKRIADKVSSGGRLIVPKERTKEKKGIRGNSCSVSAQMAQ